MDRFRYDYSKGDELQRMVRESVGTRVELDHGQYGRILSRNGHPFAYDEVGRRSEDDRFVYRWSWRGELMEVTVKDSWPDGEVTPFSGHQIRYAYDARGRLTFRTHWGPLPEGESDESLRSFVERRDYVWEDQSLLVETGYGDPSGTQLRWRKTYVPGAYGLDDAFQVAVDVIDVPVGAIPGSRLYTYLRDELGTVIGLVAEDEGTDPHRPPIPVRYLYTPYGEVHVETSPELRRGFFDNGLTAVAGVSQEIADELTRAGGGLRLSWSVGLDDSTLASGLIVERLESAVWVAVPGAEIVVAKDEEDPAEVLVLHRSGWERGFSYRVRLTSDLSDGMGRFFAGPENLEWRVPEASTGEAIPVVFERVFEVVFESFSAAQNTVSGRFPGGQTCLFQGLWTDPVTGINYARARWYDARNASWLSEDPLLDVDSPNLYAFVKWRPNEFVDPFGTVTLLEALEDLRLTPHEIVNLELSQSEIEAIIGSQTKLELAGPSEPDYQRKNQARAEFILLRRSEAFMVNFDVSYLLLRSANPPHFVFETAYAMQAEYEPVRGIEVNGGEKALELIAYFTALYGTKATANWLGRFAPKPGTSGKSPTTESRRSLSELRARVRELGRDPDRGVVDVREGVGGVRLEARLGRQIRRGESGADFVDDAPNGLGEISLKGPLPVRARGNHQGLINAAIDDLSKNSGASSLVIDLRGLSQTAAAEVQAAVRAALPGARFPKTLVFLDP